MKFLILLLLGSVLAHAEVGDIRCKGSYQIITSAGMLDTVTADLTKADEDRAIRFEGMVKDRAFSLVGDAKTGDFLLMQTWGPDFSEGIVATVSFTSSGRLQISSLQTVPVNKPEVPQVKFGTALYKLECTKVLASQFPNQ
jgi:hypothetical protein